MARTKPLGATEAARKNPLGAIEVDRPKPRAAGEMDRTTPLGATEVDRRLRQALHHLQLAERNAVLWFAEVLKRRLFKDLGFSSIYQYASEALGFSPPRTAQFIRLCQSLEGLPALKSSVATGEVSWTKAREVAKVATPQTESAWVDLARTESRRKLERRVRLAQTRSRAKRRDGGRQLGLTGGGRQPGPAEVEPPPGSADGGREPGLVNTDKSLDSQAGRLRTTPADSPGAPQAGIPSTSPADPSSAQTTCDDDADAMPPDVAFAEVPVTLSLRFTPEQYARYEAILEQLRKRGERGAREELILAGLEALLVDAGSSAAESEPRNAKSAEASGATSASAPRATTSPRDAKSASANDTAPVSQREANSAAVRSATPVSKRHAAPVSPRNLKVARQIPAYQIVVQQCEDCGRARVQTSRGAKAVSTAAAEVMRCDSRVLRPGDRNRATIPPGVRREVLARDGYRCRAPGCGSARFLEVHHVVPRAAGGSNRPDNLVTLCSACHRLTHSLPLHAAAFPGASTSEAPRRAVSVSRRDVGPVSPGEGASDAPHQATPTSKQGSPLAHGPSG